MGWLCCTVGLCGGWIGVYCGKLVAFIAWQEFVVGFIDGLLHDFVCCLLRLLSVVACLGSLIVVIVSCGVLVIIGLVLVVG